MVSKIKKLGVERLGPQYTPQEEYDETFCIEMEGLPELFVQIMNKMNDMDAE